MHMFQIKFTTMFPNLKRYSWNGFNVALVFFIFLFGLFTIDGDQTLCDGLRHNCFLHCHASGTEIVSKNF